MKAVVLLSGGIDSATSLAIAKAEGFEIYALSFDYGQRHRVELESARKVASSLGAKKHLIMKFDLREIGGSALTSDIEVPKQVQSSKFKVQNKENSELRTQNSELIPVTYVPARNTIFLSFALAWAEVLGAEDIFIGANSLDYSGYPDCRPEYIEAFENMANLAVKEAVEGRSRYRIRSPLIKMTKAEIIKMGIELGVNYGLTWSCYDPQPATAGVQSSKFKVQIKNRNSERRTPIAGVIPCGNCDSCLYRKKGFTEAKFEDPLVEQ